MSPSVPDVDANDESHEAIAIHEAGHALMAHLLGIRVERAYPYDGPVAGRVVLEEVVPRAVALAGMLATMVTGFRHGGGHCEHDMAIAQSSPAEVPLARPLLMKHLGSLAALGAWFAATRVAIDHDVQTKATTERRYLKGEDVHAFLKDHGCEFGCEA